MSLRIPTCPRAASRAGSRPMLMSSRILPRPLVSSERGTKTETKAETSWPRATIGDVQSFGVLTRRTVALWIGVLLAVVFAVSAIIGFLAVGWDNRWDEFNWEVAAIAGTALGTTALAGFTGALAFTTSGDVQATWELARLSSEQVAAQERPVVIQFDARFSGSAAEGDVVVELFNAGDGAALCVETTVTYIDEEHPASGTYIVPAIRPGGTAGFTIPVRFQEPYPAGGVRGDGFKLSGTYRDRSQRNTYEIITEWSTVGGQSDEPLVAFA